MSNDLTWGLAVDNKVSAPGKAIEKSLKSVDKALHTVEKDMGKTGKVSKVFGEMMTGALRSIGERAVGMGASVAGALADAAIGFAKMALHAHGSKEDAKNALTSILGDAKKADHALASVHGLSNFLGADPKPLTEALVALTQQGHSTSDAMAILQGSLDLKALNPKKSLDQILESFTELDAKGKAGEDTLEKFAKLGIKRETFLAELAKRLGTDAKGAAQALKDGTLSVGAAQNVALVALTKQTGGALGSFAKKQSGSWNGLIENLGSVGDRWANALDTNAALAPVQEMMRKLTDALNPESETGKKIIGALSKVAKNIGDAIGKIDFNALAANVERTAQALATGATNGKAFFGAMIERSVTAVTELTKVANVIDRITGRTEAGTPKVNAHGLSWEKVGKVLGVVGGVIGFVATRIVGSFVDAFLWAVGLVTGLIDKIAAALKYVDGLIKVFAQNGITATFKKIGKDIVDGIWNGITGAWRSMVARFKGLVDMLPDAAKKALGIASPSKEFRWIGKMIGEGTTLGVNDNAADVKSSLVGLVTPPAVPSVTTNTSSNRSSRTANVTVNFYGSPADVDTSKIEEAVARGVDRAFANLAFETGAAA
jgi:hypothetical protein